MIVKTLKKNGKRKEQGRIHGNTVADGWAGAVVRKPLGIQKCYGTDGPTDQPTRQGVESRLFVCLFLSATKNFRLGNRRAFALVGPKIAGTDCLYI